MVQMVQDPRIGLTNAFMWLNILVRHARESYKGILSTIGEDLCLCSHTPSLMSGVFRVFRKVSIKGEVELGKGYVYLSSVGYICEVHSEFCVGLSYCYLFHYDKRVQEAS